MADDGHLRAGYGAHSSSKAGLEDHASQVLVADLTTELDHVC